MTNQQLSLAETKEALSNLPSDADPYVRQLLSSLVRAYELLAFALPYTLVPCDMAVECPDCKRVWWGVEEDLTENWHNSGCQLFHAGVLAGTYTDVRRTTAENVAPGWTAPTIDPQDAQGIILRPLRKPPTFSQAARLAILDKLLERFSLSRFQPVPKDITPTVSQEAWKLVLEHLILAVLRDREESIKDDQ